MAKPSLPPEPASASARGAEQDKIHSRILQWIRIARRRVQEEWRSKGTSGRAMRQLSSLARGKMVEQKAQGRRQLQI